MEHTLNEEMDRVTEKGRNLDARILRITRLEARLHEALLQQEPQTSPNKDQTDRKSLLDLRERVSQAYSTPWVC